MLKLSKPELKTHILIVFICIFLPLADILNGICLEYGLLDVNGIFGLSQIFRIFIVLYFLWSFRKLDFSVSIFISFCFFVEVLAFYYHRSMYGLSIGFVNIFRIFFGYSLYKIFSDGLKRIDELYFYRYMMSFVFLYSINILFCFSLGLGRKTQENSFGVTGFIASNNALSFVIGVGLLLTLMHTSNKVMDKIRNFAITVACILVGAKTSAAFMLAYLVIRLSNYKYKLCAFGLFCFFIYYFSEYIGDFLIIIFDVIYFRLQNANWDDWVNVVTTGRVGHLFERCDPLFYDLSSVIRVVLGSGSFISCRNPNYAIELDYLMLEMDPVDLIFSYGLIVFIAYFYISILFLKRAIKFNNALLVTIWLLCFLFSILAGHALYDGMSIVILAYIASVINFKVKTL